jgi:hypothetical protein
LAGSGERIPATAATAECCIAGEAAIASIESCGVRTPRGSTGADGDGIVFGIQLKHSATNICQQSTGAAAAAAPVVGTVSAITASAAASHDEVFTEEAEAHREIAVGAQTGRGHVAAAGSVENDRGSI